MRGTLICLALISFASSPQERPLFSSHSDLVVLQAMVEDRRGAAVPGLTQDNFLIYEDNRPQQIKFFSTADAPASIGLLIDNSTSMISKRERVIAAASKFTELSHPQDEVFVLAFNEKVREAWAPRILVESDLSVLHATLKSAISARGQTALYDAVSNGLERLSGGKHTRQVLVVISDGTDNASQATVDDMLGNVQSGGATIYTVALRDDVDHDSNPRLLERIATLTGGEAFNPKKIDDVPDALEHIARDIRATYTLGFVPTNQARDGSLRRIRVSARDRDGRPLKVQTRVGYRAAKGTTSPREGCVGAR